MEEEPSKRQKDNLYTITCMDICFIIIFLMIYFLLTQIMLGEELLLARNSVSL
jgi:hypothetical protein